MVVMGGLACDRLAPLPTADLIPEGTQTVSGGHDSGPSQEVEVPDGCPDPLSWGNTGQPFLLTYCAGCHGAEVSAEMRYGAPADSLLDSRHAVLERTTAVLSRSSDGTMPPGGGPTELELACFTAWLEQGARGRGDALPDGGAVSGEGVAWEVAEEVVALDDFPEGLVLVTQLIGVGRPSLTGDWSSEYWAIEGPDGWLSGRDRVELDGSLVFSDAWEPPLPFTSPTADNSWTVETTRTRLFADGEAVFSETWDFTRDPDVQVDPRILDEEVVRVVGVERTTGATVGIERSDRLVLLRRWFDDDSETADPALVLSDTTVFESPLPPGSGEFPLLVDQSWTARLLGVE